MNVLNQRVEDLYTLYQGDCVEVVRGLPSDSVHYTIFSPPFASLYTYSNSDRDMGNSRDDAEFAEHFGFLIQELYRVTMPGRLVSVHCMNLPAMKSRDGYIGIKDFRGDIIRQFIESGFIFHSEVVIFRKPGENPEMISHTPESFPVNVWQRYASPVWMDIRQSNTLQRTSARDEKDEKHICPLQLDVIERGIDLWTNPGDIVLDPFAGIGSVPYQAVLMGRRGLGCELKESYFKQAVKNLEEAERLAGLAPIDTTVLLRCPICGHKIPNGGDRCPACDAEAVAHDESKIVYAQEPEAVAGQMRLFGI